MRSGGILVQMRTAYSSRNSVPPLTIRVRVKAAHGSDQIRRPTVKSTKPIRSEDLGDRIADLRVISTFPALVTLTLSLPPSPPVTILTPTLVAGHYTPYTPSLSFSHSHPVTFELRRHGSHRWLVTAFEDHRPSILFDCHRPCLVIAQTPNRIVPDSVVLVLLVQPFRLAVPLDTAAYLRLVFAASPPPSYKPFYSTLLVTSSRCVFVF
ncbi:hypothetical protein PIB30_034232 [Stylosanthes scabra]|uniref:Uncharacterized protein n=1 Tax=Stylosanthes scabra TaxID=79078 RepID=A0ABU6UC52_9FABA|nr:hypothetical protein [Stylosanthes scabra]